MTNIALICESPAKQSEAKHLALELDLSLLEKPPFPPYLLVVTDQRLELRQIQPPGPGPVSVDFLAAGITYRRRHSMVKNEAIARAMGLKKIRPTVLDGTAGLGKDSFILAALGCQVQLYERSPIISALLADGLRRAREDKDIRPIINRMNMTKTDSKRVIPVATILRPDVIYLDPMYPHRPKSGLVKKEMRYLRAIVGDDPDSDKLLPWALNLAAKRVVVKRPNYAKHLGPPPSLTVKSKKNRFDVYLTGN